MAPRKPADPRAVLLKELAKTTSPEARAALLKVQAAFSSEATGAMGRLVAKARGKQADKRARAKARQAPPPPKSMAQKRRGSMYSYTITFDYVNHTRADEKRNKAAAPCRHGIVKTATIAYDADHKLMTGEEERLIDEELQRLNGTSSMDAVETVPTNRVVRMVEIRAAARPLKQARQKSVSAPGISGWSLVNTSYDTKQGQCVPDWLRFLFGKVPGCQGICANNRTIALALTGYFGEYGTDTHVRPTPSNIRKGLFDPHRLEDIEDILHNGATTEHCSNFARAIGANMYATDEDGEIFEFYRAPKHTGGRPALAFRVQNNHMYPIVDRTTINRFSGIVTSFIAGSGAVMAAKARAEADAKPEKDVRLVSHVADNLNAYSVLVQQVREHGNTLPFGVTMNEHGPRSLTYKEGDGFERHVIGSSTDVATHFAARMDLPIKQRGTALPHIAEQALAKFCPALRKSTPNPQLDALLRADNVKARTHHGLWAEDLSAETLQAWVRDGDALCMDISKAYPTAVALHPDPWMVFGYNDHLRPFDLAPDTPLPLGLYVVQTNDYTLLHGYNVYSRLPLMTARHRGIAFKVVAYVTPSDTLPPETFREVITRIVEASAPHGSELSPADLLDAAKLLLACITGTLGKDTSTTYGKGRINTDRERAMEWLNDERKTKGHRRVLREIVASANITPNEALEVFGATEAWLYTTKEQRELRDHNVPMYIQLTDYANLLLDEMIQATGGELLYRKVDCCVVLPASLGLKEGEALEFTKVDAAGKPLPTKDWQAVGRKGPSAPHMRVPIMRRHLSAAMPLDPSAPAEVRDHAVEFLDTFGNYRREKAAPKYICELQARDISDETIAAALPQEWDQLRDLTDSSQHAAIIAAVDAGDGLVVEGWPGMGKTFIANKMIEAWGADHVVCLAIMHTAALNLNGRTLASFVGRAFESEQASMRGTAKALDGITHVIFDELSMASRIDLEHLCLVKRMRPDIKFVMLGDRRQLGAVGDDAFDYFEHAALKWLVGGQRVTLAQAHRNSRELVALMERSWDGKLDPARELGGAPETCRINLVANNVAAWHVNDLWMRRESAALPDGEKVFVKEDPEDEQARDAWLFDGLPLVSRTTAKDGSQLNSELFVLTGLDVEAGTFMAVSQKRFDSAHTEYAVADFHKHFVPGYAMTVHKVQGATITEDIAIWNYGSMGRRARWTALSRAKTVGQLHAGELPADVDSRLLQNIAKKLRGCIAHDAKLGRPLSDMPFDELVRRLHDMLAAQDTKCRHCHCQLKTKDWKAGDERQMSIDRLRAGRAYGHVFDNLVWACLKCQHAHANECWGTVE